MEIGREQVGSRVLAGLDAEPPRASLGEGAFVGRESELAAATRVLHEAIGGRGRVMLLGGEPGIGKSRLAGEFAAIATTEGVRVVWGRSWEAGGAPPYWPWLQSLGELARSRDGAVDPGAEADPDVPALLAGAHWTDGVGPSNPDTARFRLFEAVAEFLHRHAARQPLMLVLDDLQVADTPSLLLLRFVAGAVRSDRILLLATYRDTELLAGGVLPETLAELARESNVRRINLRGLSKAEVAQYMGDQLGTPPSDAVAEAMHDRSEGNPLFVQELVRLLAEEGSLDGQASRVLTSRLPTNLLEILRRRLKPLPEVTLEIVTRAAVLGREFELGTLARFSHRTVGEVVVLLQSARSAGVIIEIPGVRDCLRFSHVLLRESVLGDLAAPAKSELHRQAGEALEQMHTDDIEPYLAELAYHFLEAEHDGDAAKAFTYTRRAGDRALDLLAYEEAVRLYEAAREVERRFPERDPARLCELLLALGDAHGRAGDEVLSERTFVRAADLARANGLHEHLARAALGYGGRLTWKRAGADKRVVPLLREGLTVIDRTDSPLRARLLARLAGAMRDDPSMHPREDFATEAVAIARRLGDDSTLGYCLEGLFGALWRPDNVAERLAIADEIISLGSRAGDLEREASGQMYRMIVHFELGDIPAMLRDRAGADRAAVALRQPTRTWWATCVRALLAFFQGRFDESEALTSEALALGARAYRSDALVHYVMHRFQLRREQGRLGEIEVELADVARDYPSFPMTRAALALLYVELGRREEAVLEFESLARDDFAGLPWDNEWLFAMSLVAEAACLLDDRDCAAVLYERLLPFASRNALGPAEGCTGSVHRVLGLLASTLGRFEEAGRQFELALEKNERMGAMPWLVRTQLGHARMLLSQGDRKDVDRARELLVSALAACERMGMVSVGASVSSMLAGLSPAPIHDGAPQHSDAAAPRGASFRREGEYWTIEFARTTRLRDSKGLRYLAVLLAHPGREFHAIDMLAGPGPVPADLPGAPATEDGPRWRLPEGIETIDAEAREAYRARIAELREELDEAERFHDRERVARAHTELQVLTDELAGAFGLGGRRRLSPSAAERARQSVTKALHDALRRIQAADPALGDHLSRSVRTGSFCIYDPDAVAAPRWSI